VRQAEADDETVESLQENENYVEFLTKEVSFNGQLLLALKGIQGVKEILQQAEDLAEKKKIVEALFKLEGGIWTSQYVRSFANYHSCLDGYISPAAGEDCTSCADPRLQMLRPTSPYTRTVYKRLEWACER